MDNMKKIFKLVPAAIFPLIMVIITGCGMLNGGADEFKEPFYNGDFYESGEGIAAVKYADTKDIKLFILNQDTDSYEEISQGDYINPESTVNFRIQIGSGNTDEETVTQRVFMSDGGSVYAKEALPDEEKEYYFCEFEFNKAYTLTHPILIQVVYPDKTASKKKFVITTQQHLKPLPGQLVTNGLGITISEKILNGLTSAVEPLLSTQYAGSTVTSFGIADNGPGKDTQGVFHIEGVVPFPIFGIKIPISLNCDLALNEVQDNVRGLYLEVEDQALVEGFAGTIPIGPLSFPLADMLAGLGGSEGGGEGDMLASLLGNIQADSALFLNIYGLPENTNSNFAAIGAGLYAADVNGLETDESDAFLWPEVIISEHDTKDIPFDMTRINSDTKFDMGIAASQYNLNQLLSDMMQTFKIVIGGDIISILTDYFPADNASHVSELAVTANPEGIALDMSDPSDIRIAANDLQLELLENGEPVALFSLDVTVKLGLSITSDGNDLSLNIEILPLLDLCNWHVIKDNKGVGLIDHTELVPVLFEAIAGTKGDEPFIFPISLSDLGFSPSTQGNDTAKIEYDNNGNCFMSLALDSIDPEPLLGDSCFIATADF